jgi:hypothetical protein
MYQRCQRLFLHLKETSYPEELVRNQGPKDQFFN